MRKGSEDGEKAQNIHLSAWLSPHISANKPMTIQSYIAGFAFHKKVFCF